MAFPAQVLQQAQYDASIGGKNMPKNAIQRAQSFLRSKLMPGAPTPNPSTMTSQQQAAFDAKQGGRLLKDFNKTRATVGPAGDLGGLKGGGLKGGLVTGLVGAAGSMVIPHIAREAVRGGLVVTGQDTTNYDDLNAGRPVVKNIGGVSYNIATPEGLRGALKAKEKGEKESFVTPPETPPETPTVGPPSSSADPRNAEYLTARNALTKDSSTADIQAVEDKGMTAWAKANPGLASKVKSGQSGYGLIQNIRGQGTDAYDANETFKPSDIPEADRQNPVEQAKARGITNLQDAQSFKNTAMDALLTASQDPNVTPIVEGMTIPTTTNYAGAFNQADMPDLQSMINMGKELGSLGIEGPKFAQSQKFKDLFMNTMLSK
jgi:hypothetical protein